MSTVTATELGYLDGVTSRIQTQLNSITGDISDIQSTLEGLSGGGGKYITSGFSNYVGHSAIAIGTYEISTSYDTQPAISVGLINSRGIVSGYTLIHGSSVYDISTDILTNTVAMIVF